MFEVGQRDQRIVIAAEQSQVSVIAVAHAVRVDCLDQRVDVSTSDNVIELRSGGPQGPPGRDGKDGDLHYEHPQHTPDTVWIVRHNLGKRPAVLVTDSAGEEILSDIDHLDENTLRLTFAAPFAGAAYCN